MEPYQSGTFSSNYKQASGIIVIASPGSTLSADIDMTFETANEDEYAKWLAMSLLQIKEQERSEIEKIDRINRAEQIKAVWLHLFPDLWSLLKRPGYFKVPDTPEILEIAKSLYNMPTVKVRVTGKISVTAENNTITGSVFIRESAIRFEDEKVIKFIDASPPVLIGSNSNTVLGTTLVNPLTISPL